mmetsp:Transcript_178502/g.566407  ORF Transcript_178502/g.566407 Transcript_178502/m.566407 type:complete len:125 (-) Transcript_178502:157-531(-)
MPSELLVRTGMSLMILRAMLAARTHRTRLMMMVMPLAEPKAQLQVRLARLLKLMALTEKQTLATRSRAEGADGQGEEEVPPATQTDPRHHLQRSQTSGRPGRADAGQRSAEVSTPRLLVAHGIP